MACELELFDKVNNSRSPVTVKALSKANKWNEDGTSRLLNTLVSLKFMAKSANASGQDTYTVTPAGLPLVRGLTDSLWSYAQDTSIFAEGMVDLAAVIQGKW